MRPEELCAGVPDAYRAHAIELMEQLDFIQKKLEETRQNLEDAPLFFMTKNTRGDIVPKRNPVYDEYNALMSTYNRTIAHMREILDGAEAEQLPAKGKLVSFAKYSRVG